MLQIQFLFVDTVQGILFNSKTLLCDMQEKTQNASVGSLFRRLIASTCAEACEVQNESVPANMYGFELYVQSVTYQ